MIKILLHSTHNRKIYSLIICCTIYSQGSKPSTSSGPVEKVNVEPPTANIKPMAGPSSTQSKQQPVSSDSYLEFKLHHDIYQHFNRCQVKAVQVLNVHETKIFFLESSHKSCLLVFKKNCRNMIIQFTHEH